jgi:hypothetical protein
MEPRGRSGRRTPFAAAVLFLGAVLARASAGHAQVSCADADDLCTGDPCVIPSIEVADPCVVDFGARTVIVAGTLRPPPDGTMSLTAGAIEVQGRISLVGGSFPDHPVTTVTAGGALTLGPVSNLGDATLEGALSVAVEGPISGFVRSLQIASSAGAVTLQGLRRGPALAGDLVVAASSHVVLDGTLDATGIGGRSVVLSSALGDVTLNGRLLARNVVALTTQPTIDVVISAAGTAFVNDDIDGSGECTGTSCFPPPPVATRGGTIRIEAATRAGSCGSEARILSGRFVADGLAASGGAHPTPSNSSRRVTTQRASSSAAVASLRVYSSVGMKSSSP